MNISKVNKECREALKRLEPITKKAPTKLTTQNRKDLELTWEELTKRRFNKGCEECYHTALIIARNNIANHPELIKGIKAAKTEKKSDVASDVTSDTPETPAEEQPKEEEAKETPKEETPRKRQHKAKPKKGRGRPRKK